MNFTGCHGCKIEVCFATLPCHPILPPPGKSLHTADQATALPQVHQLLLVNSRAVYFFSDLRRHIAPPSQIVLSTGAGDLPLLYRVLQTLPTLSHYLRCIFDYEKKLWGYFFLPPRRKIAHATSHFTRNGCRLPSTPVQGPSNATKVVPLFQVCL